jgi:hypothetical protein
MSKTAHHKMEDNFALRYMFSNIRVYESLSYTILLEDLLGIKKCPQKHGGSGAIAMTTGP